jgi:hypothetical protein
MQRYAEWRKLLAGAADVDTVQAIVREYVDALGPAKDQLPHSCRVALEEGLDVHAAAVTMLREELRFAGPDETRALLQEVAFTLAAASVRVAALPPPRAPARPRAAQA